MSQLVFLALIRAGSRNSSGGGGGSGLEFFEGGGGRVQVCGNFHILTSKTKTTSEGGVVNPPTPPPLGSATVDDIVLADLYDLV